MNTSCRINTRSAVSAVVTTLVLLLGSRVAFTQGASTAVQTTPQPVQGITNYHRVDALFACGGSVTDEGVAELQREGVRAVVNLRESSEPDANVETEGEAVRRAGMIYLHIPFNGKAPTAEPIDRFLAALDDPANQPLYIHCHTGNRAAAMWMAKRALRDGWPIDKAEEEAVALGLRDEALKKFVIDYIEQRRK